MNIAHINKELKRRRLNVSVGLLIIVFVSHTTQREMATASFRWILQLHRDVPKAARFYEKGLDFSVNVVTLRWAELHSGPLKLALMQCPRYCLNAYNLFDHLPQRNFESSFFIWLILLRNLC